MFGVYHPRKPGQIRVVFDSSAQSNGLSLNNVLLTGPDLNNSLIGVLIRFRREKIAVTADIEQMFHCFVVREDHRDYLRFLWFRENDPSKDIVEYRMRVHVFGNSSSPAVATYCLRRAAQQGEQQYGLFDPLGFVAPVTIQGKSLLRELTLEGTEWDVLLPQEKLKLWETWRDSLQELQHLHIPRAYTTTSPSKAKQKEICIFSDASTKAIGAVAYLRTTNEDGQIHVGFILGKAKLSPPSEPTIPRLGLCAAVLAVEMAELIVQEIDLPLDAVTFYCDSKVVLGYIHNQSKRFYVYVHNRVQRIRQSTDPKQWRYVPTEHNPADHASRSVQASILTQTNWFTGPAFLYKQQAATKHQQSFEIIDPDSDVEIRPQVTSCMTGQRDKRLDPKRFERFSSWKSLQRVVATLLHVTRSFKSTNQDVTVCSGWHQCSKPHSGDELSKSSEVILRAVQRACFSEEYDPLSKGQDVNKKSSLSKLNPVIGPDGLLRIGGRLKLADLSDPEKHPIILPADPDAPQILTPAYLHLGSSPTKTCSSSSGARYKGWLINSGVAGSANTCTLCKFDTNGRNRDLTLKMGMSLC
ncbi:uncharacterized protein ACBT44_004535 [Syngnathus typhle]